MKAPTLFVAATSAMLIVCALQLSPMSGTFDAFLLGSTFGLTEERRPFLLVTGIGWLLACLVEQPARGSVRPCYATCFVSAFLGNVGVALSHDAVSFYTGFALLSLSSYGLIVTGDDRRQRAAGDVYLTLAVLGEVCLFTALVWLTAAGATLLPMQAAGAPGWVSALLLIGFGIKAGLVPLHFTLPMAYEAAPPAAGVALAGAALNAGVLGWLSWMPLAEPGPVLGQTALALAVFGYVYAFVTGVAQQHPRALLGYSSVTQVALMLAALATGLLDGTRWPALAPALTLMMVQHALAKTLLFALTSTSIRAATPPAVFWLLLIVASLSLAGTPLTGGFAAKSALDASVSAVAASAWLSDWLWLSSLLTTALMARFAWLLRTAPDSASSSLSGTRRLLAIGTALALAAALLAAGMNALPADATRWAAKLAPVLAGLVLAAALLALWRRRIVAVVALPAGDVVSPLARALRRRAEGRRASDLHPASDGRWQAPLQSLSGYLGSLVQSPPPRWRNVGLLVLVLCLLMVSLLTLAL